MTKKTRSHKLGSGSAGRGGGSAATLLTPSDWLKVAAAGLLTAVLTLVVPWFVPVGAVPLLSDSYAVGFSNRAAVVGLVVGCALMLGIGWRLVLPAGPKAPGTPQRYDRIDALGVGVMSILTVGYFSWVVSRTYGFPIADAQYFLQRTALALNGFIPYRDFDFAYGPVLLYAPLGLRALLHPFGVTTTLAWYLTTAVVGVAGVVELAFVLNRLQLRRSYRWLLFGTLGFFALGSIATALSYTLVRFLTPVLAVTLLAETSSRVRASGRQPWMLSGVALAGVVVCAGVSPEMGVVEALACVGFFVAMGLKTKDRSLWISLGVFSAGVVVLLVLAASQLGPTTLVAMAGGALSMPLVPGPPAVLYLATALLCAFLLPGMIRATSEPVEVGTIVALAALGLVLMVPALGRTDFGHIFWNGIPFWLLGALALQRVSARATLVFLSAVALVFVGGVIWFAAHFTERDISSSKEVAAVGVTQEQVNSLSALSHVAFPGSAIDDVPFWLADRGKLAAVPYDVNGPFDEAQLGSGLAALRSAQAVVVTVAYYNSLAVLAGQPEGSASSAVPQPGTYLQGDDYTILFQSPFNALVKNVEYDGNTPIKRFLIANFGPTGRLGSYVILTRKATP